MLSLKAIFALNTILLGALHGHCARSVPEVSNDNLKNSLIQAQSIGRIVNRQSHKEIDQNIVHQVSYGNDITRISNLDTGYPCVHETPQINVIENPPVTRTELATQISSHSTFSAGFPMPLQNPRPAQHIHYHYLVPNETPTRPSITYAPQSDLKIEKHFVATATQTSHVNEHYDQLQYSNQEVLPGNALYSPANHNVDLYDSPDEHQAQGSENTSFYEAIRSPIEVFRQKNPSQTQEAIFNTVKQEIVLKGQPNKSQQAPVLTTKTPEVYFIKYHGNSDIETTTFPPNHKPDDTSDTNSDGNGLIDIRSGIDEGNTLDSQHESNEHSSYNVPLN